MNNIIYFDNASTTKISNISKRALDDMLLLEYGNSSSMHSFGIEVEKILSNSSDNIARILGTKKENVVFTSCATESNTMLCCSVLKKYKNFHCITLETEHPSITENFLNLQKQGVDVTILPVEKDGSLTEDSLVKALKPNTMLISISYVNNEIGIIQPISKFAKVLKECQYKGFFHTDATQALGKFDCNINNLGVDALSASSHKMHGPKGVGLFYFSERFPITPMFFGGSQQNSIRPGTVNTPSIVAFEKALLDLENEKERNYNKLLKFRKKVYDFTLKNKHLTLIGGTQDNFSPYICSLGSKDLPTEVILNFLDQKNIMVASSSACSSRSKISRVINSLNNPLYKNGAVRLSFSRDNTEEELDFALKILEDTTLEISKNIH